MATSTTNMGLEIPVSGDADYPSTLSDSLVLIDAHDHTPGKGVPIPGAAISNNAISTPKIADGAVTGPKLDATVLASLMPPGLIAPFGGTVAPTGWLMCDGTAYNRLTYSGLFGVIGTAWGYGDGSTTFNVPDLRGQFLRGRSAGTGKDPDAASRTAIKPGGATGDNVGSAQGTATKRPNAAFTTGTESNDHTHSIQRDNQAAVGGGAVYGFNSGSPGTYATTTGASASHTHTVAGGGDNESRPPNVAVNYIIKT